jgi:alkylhydroperoxidase family enzyme
MHDPYADLMHRLRRVVLHGKGALDPAVRAALVAGGEPPDSLATYVAKVARHAYQVTGDDISALRASGYSEDQIFEATISVALHAALERLDAGLGAVRAVDDEGKGA